MPASKKGADAVTLLKADPRKVDELFDKFEAAKSESKKKMLASQICLELTVHTKIEEEIFYPACKEVVEDELWHESFVEHDGAKVLVAEIEAGDPGDEFYDAKVKVLSEMIKHHVKEEERRGEGLFAQAREGGLDFDALGAQLAKRKKELLAEFKASGLPKPQTQSLTGTKLAA